MLRRMKAFETRSYGIVIPPYFNGEQFVYPGSVVIPTHDQYNLDDLLNAGIKVAPVDTAILHDNAAISNNIAVLSESKDVINV